MPRSRILWRTSRAAASALRSESRVSDSLSGRCSFVAVNFVFGLGLIIFVLDLILGDWFVDHVAFWDEPIGFYDWLFSHAS
jgi:hypothetical protein